ncbi:MAG: iron response transcriptional regulator IrrA [Alphaproteobacteria bacterium]
MNSKLQQIKKQQTKKLAGRKYDSAAALLQGAGLRPTKQRLVLAEWLFDGCDKHVTAEQVHEAAVKMRVPVSLATVYNSLNHFIAAGLLRHVAIDGGHVYFDTNTDDHYHLFDENSGWLTDIPASAVRLAQLPKLPQGKRLSRVDVVVRVRE